MLHFLFHCWEKTGTTLAIYDTTLQTKTGTKQKRGRAQAGTIAKA